MTKFSLSGIIKYEHPELKFEKIKLIQDDGYKIDLIGRFQELKESHPPLKIQVNYFISEKPCSLEEAKKRWLAKISGALKAEYNSEEYHYSKWSYGIDYESNLKIGGHSLFDELRQYENKFLILKMS